MDNVAFWMLVASGVIVTVLMLSLVYHTVRHLCKRRQKKPLEEDQKVITTNTNSNTNRNSICKNSSTTSTINSNSNRNSCSTSSTTSITPIASKHNSINSNSATSKKSSTATKSGNKSKRSNRRRRESLIEEGDDSSSSGYQSFPSNDTKEEMTSSQLELVKRYETRTNSTSSAWRGARHPLETRRNWNEEPQSSKHSSGQNSHRIWGRISRDHSYDQFDTRNQNATRYSEEYEIDTRPTGNDHRRGQRSSRLYTINSDKRLDNYGRF